MKKNLKKYLQPAGHGEDLGLCYMLLFWKNSWLSQAEFAGVCGARCRHGEQGTFP